MIEYKVRPVTRFIVTKFVQDGKAALSEGCGEFGNERQANRIAAALAYHDTLIGEDVKSLPLGWECTNPACGAVHQYADAQKAKGMCSACNSSEWPFALTFRKLD